MAAFIHVFLFAFLFFAVPASAVETMPAYLRYLPDVPLMPAMAELEEQSMIFDKAEGKVIESTALAGNLSEKEVNEFYDHTLPSLGWTAAGAQRFLRNGEQLIVKWEKLPGGSLVRFSLSPKQGQSPEKNF